MTMFRGVKPKSQPRTLRTIAEQKGTTPAGFDGADEPEETKLRGEYDDKAEAAKGGSPTRGTNASDPKPFKNMKGR